MSDRLAINAQCFGLEFTKMLVAKQCNVTECARRIRENGGDVSVNHLSDLSRSERGPSPPLINLIGRALRLPRDQIMVLHRAAALDKGYEIGALRPHK